MKSLIDHQTKFISSVLGGPASFTNDHVERVHARLWISEPAFNEAMALLRETLEDYNFQEDDIQEVEDGMMRYKNYIVTRW